MIDIPKDVQFASGTYHAAQEHPAQDLSAAAQGRSAQDQTGRGDDGQGEKADLLHRRRRHQRRPAGLDAAARTGGADRLPGHLDPDGARRLSGLRQGLAGDARHARLLRGQQRHARLRSDDRDRRPFRRPHHRPARRLRASFQENPHRHRPVLDQQERARSISPSSAIAPMCSRTWCGCGGPRRMSVDRKALADWWAQIDRWRGRK